MSLVSSQVTQAQLRPPTAAGIVHPGGGDVRRFRDLADHTTPGKWPPRFLSFAVSKVRG
jgi:hypothetical protein